ncbi:hypothetical protein AB0A60_35635 [Streptomyces sp. NPDC046275]|uniref:hypothetical protein n=1 Tax=Streptomyces sp. NPDC046275 TaxID=3157201 RepID=UPI0033D9A58A
MENFKITWVQDGEPRESTVSFSRTAAETYLPDYQARPGASDVRIVEAPIQLVRSTRQSA